MAITGINEVSFNSVNSSKMVNNHYNTTNEPLLSFAEQNNSEQQKDISDAKIKTEMFIESIMENLDTSTSKSSPSTVKYYLAKLINVVQILNGVHENNLKPNGDSKQDKIFDSRIKELTSSMNNYAGFVGSGLSVMQDSKTGLYKLTVNDKLYDIPKRKVEILQERTEDGVELIPQIVD